jgi:excisionase family DNA binding protein
MQATARAGAPEGPPMLLRVEEAARELRIARRRIYELIASGELLSVKIGQSRRIPREELVRYVNSLSA